MKTKMEIMTFIIKEDAYLRDKGSWEISSEKWYERMAALHALKWVVGLEKKKEWM